MSVLQWRQCRCFQYFGDQCTLDHRCSSDVSVGDVGVSVTSDAEVISGLMTSVSMTSVFSKPTLHIPNSNYTHISINCYEPVIRNSVFYIFRKTALKLIF